MYNQLGLVDGDIRIFYAIGAAWSITQAIKASVIKIKNPSKSWVRIFFWYTGGMPSSHSALVTALTTYIGFAVGVRSYLFALSLGFAAITIRDSLGIRYSVGEVIRHINEISKTLADSHDTFKLKKKLKELKGHKPLEVVVGVSLGFLSAIGVLFLS